MQQWLFVVHPTRPDMLVSGPTPDEMTRVGEHFEYWKAMTSAGQALVVGRTQTTTPDTIGLAIFLAKDESEAQTIAENDPAVKSGVFKMELYPYKVALLGDTSGFRPEA